MSEKLKFTLALCLFVLPGLGALVTQKEVWPFSHYPMFSTSKKIKKFGAVRVIASFDNEEKQLETYKELFPLGPQCTVKLLVEENLSNIRNYEPDIDQQNNLKTMSRYYRTRAFELYGRNPVAISIMFYSYDYTANWREPVEKKKLIWKEEVHEN